MHGLEKDGAVSCKFTASYTINQPSSRSEYKQMPSSLIFSGSAFSNDDQIADIASTSTSSSLPVSDRFCEGSSKRHSSVSSFQDDSSFSAKDYLIDLDQVWITVYKTSHTHS